MRSRSVGSGTKFSYYSNVSLQFSFPIALLDPCGNRSTNAGCAYANLTKDYVRLLTEVFASRRSWIAIDSAGDAETFEIGREIQLGK